MPTEPYTEGELEAGKDAYDEFTGAVVSAAPIEVTECDTELGGCGCGCPCLCTVAECPVCGCAGSSDDD